MRVLHILNRVAEEGNGITNVAVDLACSQRAAGHDVMVCSAGGEFEGLLEQHGVLHRSVVQDRTPATLLRAVRRFRAEAERFRPDIVHAHMMTGAMLVRFGAVRPRYRLVTHVHNEFQHAAVLMGVGDRVIAVSAAVAASMQRRGIPASRLRVVHNGIIGSPRHRPLASYRPAELQRPAVVTVAGMYTRKGIGDLLGAFDGVAARVPGVHLYLVGDGPDRTLFEEAANRSPHARQIHFEGFQRSPQPYLLAADVFVLASHYESFGLALIEAREAGCAVVGTAVDGIPEALGGGEAGLLVPPKNPVALQAAIVGLLSDRDELARWRLRAQTDLERFSVQHVAETVDGVYRELLNVGGRRRQTPTSYHRQLDRPGGQIAAPDADRS